MNILSASTTPVTPKLTETRAFYEQHFGARPSFDCGWYVVLRLSVATSGPELRLMEPQDGMSRFEGGVFLNLLVDDADKFHAKLTEEGVPVATPQEDHPCRSDGLLLSLYRSRSGVREVHRRRVADVKSIGSGKPVQSSLPVLPQAPRSTAEPTPDLPAHVRLIRETAIGGDLRLRGLGAHKLQTGPPRTRRNPIHPEGIRGRGHGAGRRATKNS
jgi:catechol 2,3-dioxygenase-like lactoylglutathione lyase family enzyme